MHKKLDTHTYPAISSIQSFSCDPEKQKAFVKGFRQAIDLKLPQAFAEWLDMKGYEQRTEGVWYTDKALPQTTDELFDEFIDGGSFFYAKKKPDETDHEVALYVYGDRYEEDERPQTIGDMEESAVSSLAIFGIKHLKVGESYQLGNGEYIKRIK